MANPKESDAEYEEAVSIVNPGVGVRWIYARLKDELAALTPEFGFSADGTVAETQKAFATLVITGSFPKSVWKRLTQLQEQSSRAATPNRLGDDKGFTSGAKMTQVSQSQVPHFAGYTSPGRLTSHRGVHPDTSQDFIVPSLGNHGGSKPPESEAPFTGTLPRHLLAERMHKWNLRFDGASDPLTLIADLEEKIATYGINQEEVPRAMSEIFEGRAARWFRTSHLQTATRAEFWAEFLGFFLSPRYFERLEDAIRTHIQGVDETFKEYLVELRTKMEQAEYRKEEDLYRIYENMAPEYRLYIRRHEFETLEQLTRMATEYESVRQLTSSRAGIPSMGATDRQETNPRRTPNPFRSPEVPIQLIK